MRKTALLSIFLFVFILAGCNVSVSIEEKANQEIEKILNESDYENIITYKGEGEN